MHWVSTLRFQQISPSPPADTSVTGVTVPWNKTTEIFFATATASSRRSAALVGPNITGGAVIQHLAVP